MNISHKRWCDKVMKATDIIYSAKIALKDCMDILVKENPVNVPFREDCPECELSEEFNKAFEKVVEILMKSNDANKHNPHSK